MEQYKYLLVTVFNRPIEEAIRAKSPEKGFMQFSIWKKMTNEQFDCLYRILNTKTLNEDQRYTIFHNSIYVYNTVLRETTRIKKKKMYDKQYREVNKEKIKEYQKEYQKTEKYRKANKKYYQENKEKILEQRKRYHEDNRDKILEQQKRYREDNRDKISARKRAKNRRNKNGTNN